MTLSISTLEFFNLLSPVIPDGIKKDIKDGDFYLSEITLSDMVTEDGEIVDSVDIRLTKH